ncbi:hypothetical protein MKW94_022385 [Papaver nudicaule]|uniref:Neprosin PEP catalytic domain-containing protein n=1 Tax=Papaver nudicaule TaxID=74823 RepID=A0AA41RPD7_PAPNU|nr:hypothetical protein [Papaver nudicaule]
MAMGKLFVLLFVWHCLISAHYYHCVCARIQTTSKEEKDGFGDEIDEQLQNLNNPEIKKTFQTKEGVKVDCIDIHKQPSMDHHLLKNHVIQMNPSSRPKQLSSKSFSLESTSRGSWGDVNFGYLCPKGTVPIRRTTKEDQIRANSLLNTNIYHPNTDVIEPPGQHVAVRHSFNFTSPYPPIFFRGLQGEIKVDNPVVQKDQISASVLWVEGGPKDVFSTIQAGWMVAPTIFGDSHTHLSIYWRNGPDQGNCVNMYCKGFIQTSDQVPIGEVLSAISEYGGKQYSFIGLLFQDPDTRNWWFSITANNVTFDIGYIPHELVPYLDPASYIAWGGLVKSPPNTPSPQMGNGHFPDGDFDTASSIWDHMFVDLSHNLKTTERYFFGTRYDSEDCYTVEEDSNTSILFGGPGGNC